MGLFTGTPDSNKKKTEEAEEKIVDVPPIVEEDTNQKFLDEVDKHLNGDKIPFEKIEEKTEEKTEPKPVFNPPKKSFTYQKPEIPEKKDEVVKQRKVIRFTPKPKSREEKTEFKEEHVKEDKPDIERLIKKAQVEQKKQDKDFARVTITEAKEGINWTRAGLYLSALSMMGIIIFSQMAMELSPPLFLLIWIFGMMCFLPLGLIAGWLFLDTYMRCKILRRFRGKNYGIVNFLHVGGQRIATRIKDLDDDVVVQDGKLWILRKDGVYYLDKDNKIQLHKQISSEHLKTLPANVPCLFLDPETMNPISFKEEKSKTNPTQAGAMILGYINNQVRKNASLRRSMSFFYIIVLAVVVINLVIGLQLYTWLEELQVVVPSLQDKVSQLSSLLAELTPPAP
jgi:hypothetical protein